MRVHRFHHVAIICSDYQRSKHFYVNTLGLKIIREIYREDRHSYKLDLDVGGGGQIELFSFPDPPPRPTHPEAQGLRHLAFAVTSVEACIGILRQQGIESEPIRTDEFTGKRFTFFSDPDGLPLELYEE